MPMRRGMMRLGLLACGVRGPRVRLGLAACGVRWWCGRPGLAAYGAHPLARWISLWRAHLDERPQAGHGPGGPRLAPGRAPRLRTRLSPRPAGRARKPSRPRKPPLALGGSTGGVHAHAALGSPAARGPRTGSDPRPRLWLKKNSLLSCALVRTLPAPRTRTRARTAIGGSRPLDCLPGAASRWLPARGGQCQTPTRSCKRLPRPWTQAWTRSRAARTARCAALPTLGILSYLTYLETTAGYQP